MSGTDRQLTQETDIKQLYKSFQKAYHELRKAWIKTGGGMDMQIQIRDEGAERAFQRRSAAAKKGAEKRRKYG